MTSLTHPRQQGEKQSLHTTLGEAAPHLHQQAVWFCKGGCHLCGRDCSRLPGHCCCSPNAGMEPYPSTICVLPKSAENCKDCYRISQFSFVLLSCSLPQVALAIIKGSISEGRPCSWEMGGLCPGTSKYLMAC